VISAVAEAESGSWRRDPEAAIRRLATAYARLAQIVAPATPTGVMTLEQEVSPGLLGMLGPVRLVRWLVAAAIVSLAAFVLVGVSPLINETSARSDLFMLSGPQALLALVFRLSAAAIGAAFAALFLVSRHIEEGSYDPADDANYVIRFVLGLISGLILTELVPLGEAADGGGLTLRRPLLALIGGFSVIVVHRVLDRLVVTVETLVQGDAREIAAMREQSLRTRALEQEARSRLEAAARLLPLQTELAQGASGETTRARVQGIIDDLLSEAGQAGLGAPPLIRPGEVPARDARGA
jgi:hypothetical protein